MQQAVCGTEIFVKLSSFLHFAGFGIRTILFRKKDPILGTIIVTDKCNLKCKHCSVNNITAIVHPYEQIRREMETLYGMGIRILFFCGGETFLWRDGDRTLRDLVVEAKRMGFLIVKDGNVRMLNVMPPASNTMRCTEASS